MTIFEMAIVEVIVDGKAEKAIIQFIGEYGNTRQFTKIIFKQLVNSAAPTSSISPLVYQAAHKATKNKSKVKIDTERGTLFESSTSSLPPSSLAPSGLSFKRKTKSVKTRRSFELKTKSFSSDYKVDKKNLDVKSLNASSSVNTNFAAAMDSNNYRLNQQSQRYEGKISAEIPKMARNMDVRMRSTTFYPSYPISILLFLHHYMTAFDSNNINKETAVWLFPYFLKDPVRPHHHFESTPHMTMSLNSWVG